MARCRGRKRRRCLSALRAILRRILIGTWRSGCPSWVPYAAAGVPSAVHDATNACGTYAV